MLILDFPNSFDQILQLKNTQALTALKRLKLLLQPKKTFSKKNNGQITSVIIASFFLFFFSLAKLFKYLLSIFLPGLPKGTSSTIQAGVPAV